MTKSKKSKRIVKGLARVEAAEAGLNVTCPDGDSVAANHQREIESSKLAPPSDSDEKRLPALGTFCRLKWTICEPYRLFGANRIVSGRAGFTTRRTSR